MCSLSARRGGRGAATGRGRHKGAVLPVGGGFTWLERVLVCFSNNIRVETVFGSFFVVFGRFFVVFPSCGMPPKFNI